MMIATEIFVAKAGGWGVEDVSVLTKPERTLYNAEIATSETVN